MLYLPRSHFSFYNPWRGGEEKKKRSLNVFSLLNQPKTKCSSLLRVRLLTSLARVPPVRSAQTYSHSGLRRNGEALPSVLRLSAVGNFKFPFGRMNAHPTKKKKKIPTTTGVQRSVCK